ncbi:MAG TPA: serine/threonine-protein kinase [Verrucomicrobiales bacterium]|nr:serine/threonine-protein kinase [Verrucomicrobiales bacterium]
MSEVLEESSPEQPAPFVPPTTEVLERMLPRYEITQLIAHGGMGAVYSGMQRDLERPVAIKILPPEAARDKESIDRFRTEARAMARLSHPHIPAVFDFEVVEEFCVLVMELVEGPNVYTLIRQGQVTPPQALELLGQVCDAVQFAHSRGIIHGDIKPGNILMNKDGQVKLADFGLARLMEQGDRESESWTPMGTPEYAAPELYDKNAAPDHRADIYSLGVVLHEMLTGAPPVGEFELPGEALGLDPRVDEVIARCMELQPDARYQSAQEVRLVLREVIEEKNVPVPATVKAPTKRILKAARKVPVGAKTAASKKGKPVSAKTAPSTQKKMPGGPKSDVRLAAAGVQPSTKTKVVAVEVKSARRGLSEQAKRSILIGAAVVTVGIAIWFIATKGDKDEPVKDPKNEVVQPTPAPTPPDKVEPVPTPPEPPAPAPTPTPTPPSEVAVNPKPPEPPAPAPKPPAYKPVEDPPKPTPTKAYARVHELRITHRDEWNKKVEEKLNEDLNRLSGQYAKTLKKLEDHYVEKADASSILAVRDEADRFTKTREPVKTDDISKIAALAKYQQALNSQVAKLRASVKEDAAAVKQSYMQGLMAIEKEMDDAEDKAGSKVAASEFKKVTKLNDTALRNYFNAEDDK